MQFCLDREIKWLENGQLLDVILSTALTYQFHKISMPYKEVQIKNKINQILKLLC